MSIYRIIICRLYFRNKVFNHKSMLVLNISQRYQTTTGSKLSTVLGNELGKSLQVNINKADLAHEFNHVYFRFPLNFLPIEI